MDAKILEGLSAPFPPGAIQRTKDSETRRGYDTTGIGYQWIVDRLNTVCGLDGWGAKIIEQSITEGQTKSGRPYFEALIRLEMSIMGATRECYGGHKATDRADAQKGAYTNAIKKTAALFGCGAEAFRGELDDDHRPQPEIAQPKTQAQQPPPIPKGNEDEATEKLRKQLWAVAGRLSGEIAKDLVGPAKDLATHKQLASALYILETADICRRHDWHYDKSDDVGHANRARVERAELMRRLDYLDKTSPNARRKIVDRYCAEHRQQIGGAA